MNAISLLGLIGSLAVVIVSVSRYWHLVRLDGTGKRRVEAMAIAEACLRQQCADLMHQSEASDTLLQQRLMAILKDTAASPGDREGAERCLRCFISHQIEQACIQLERKFGSTHGFTRADLFPLVLDDDGLPKSSSENRTQPQYQTFASEILQTFEPHRAALSTWSTRLVRQHGELSAFLREHGVDLITDWAILNNTSPEQMQRILAEFHRLTPTEIAAAHALLHSYHQVYRQDRLRQRQAGALKNKTACSPPTRDQLRRMAQVVQSSRQSGNAGAIAPQPNDLPPEDLLSDLQILATQLRRYRLHIRGGQTLVTESLDQPETRERAAEIPAIDEDDDPVQQAFLTFYRHQFAQELDAAIQQVTSDRVAYLQRKNHPMAQQFLNALHLFHCQGQTMGEIAQTIGLQAQFQVTRLMKLKEFRAAIRQYLLKTLCKLILERAKTYADVTQLHQLDQQIELVLADHIDSLLKRAEAEVATAKHRPLSSVFARRLCYYLNTISCTMRTS